MEGELDLSALKKEAACSGVALIKNPSVVCRRMILYFTPDREEKQQPSTGLAKLVHETTSIWRGKLGDATCPLDPVKCLWRSQKPPEPLKRR